MKIKNININIKKVNKLVDKSNKQPYYIDRRKYYELSAAIKMSRMWE
jgi:sensor domain CHASE-containing protein